MGFSIAQKSQADNANAVQPSKTQGTLKSATKEQTVTLFPDSATVSKVIKAVIEFFQDLNQKTVAEGGDLECVLISPEQIEMQEEITKMLTELAMQEGLRELNEPDADVHLLLPSPFVKAKEADLAYAQNRSSQPKTEGHKQLSSSPTNQQADSKVIYSSLFTLARSFNKTVAEGRLEKQHDQKRDSQETKEMRPHHGAALNTDNLIRDPASQEHREQERDQREGGGKQKDQDQNSDHDKQEGQHQPDEKQDPNKKRKSKSQKEKESAFIIEKVHMRSVVKETEQPTDSKPPAIKSPSTSRSYSTNKKTSATVSSSGGRGQQVLHGIENIYIRFMALMARILGQAEAEAHQLYLRIKERTDAIDHLTLLISKINSEKGAIDWTKNEEMKQLIDRARALGVDIPEGKYKWTEDEKKMLKENIQMRKDSMEKVTQLERTDMQRFLQEASQCHQARSNVLKLLKEVTDNIIGNMRP